MRKTKYLIAFLLCLFSFNVSAKTLYVNLESLKVSSDNKKFSSIKEYDSLEEFLDDYNSSSLDDIYITNFLFDGISEVKSPDLDDIKESGKIKKLEIKVININTTGNIELTGSIKGAMIGVNTNGLKKDINIILNNVNIDTDSKKAPALFVYNKDTNYTDSKVTIKTKSGTKNYLEGGKLKKVSLVPSESLDDYSSYYSGDALSDYEEYTSYYGMYSKNEISNILFATVQADEEGLMDGDPYYFYKASGAISSDIDLYFEGEGYLKVTSKNKEGIETKGNLTFSGGTGNYEIISYDDCLNTTTSSSVKNARNSLTIDVETLVAIVNDEGDEGDAIDSNGTLTINGGTIYAFAHSNSQDAGLDSESGTYINGGTVIATGNMADNISSQSTQKSIYVQFNEKISSGTLITIKDENDNIIVAFETSKDTQTLLYSSNDLNYQSLKIYTGGVIDGEESNGLYTKVNSYQNGDEILFSEVASFNDSMVKNNNFILKLLIGEIVGLLIISLYVFIDKKLNKKSIG